MKTRLTTKDDIPLIMLIIKDAQDYLAKLNIDQWQNNYPNTETIESDIRKKESFVITNDKDEIIATAMFSLNGEPTYAEIDGEWCTEEITKYGVIHRIAVSNKARGTGAAKLIFKEFENKLKSINYNSLRIDTHKDNLIMQKLLRQLEYKYCGVIYLDDGDKRLAFEKVLN